MRPVTPDPPRLADLARAAAAARALQRSLFDQRRAKLTPSPEFLERLRHREREMSLAALAARGSPDPATRALADLVALALGLQKRFLAGERDAAFVGRCRDAERRLDRAVAAALDPQPTLF